jgi:hypothetical protein
MGLFCSSMSQNCLLKRGSGLSAERIALEELRPDCGGVDAAHEVGIITGAVVTEMNVAGVRTDGAQGGKELDRTGIATHTQWAKEKRKRR